MLEIRSRRAFVHHIAKVSLLATSGACLKISAQGEAYADPEAADRWLAPWLQAPGAVSGALHMGRFADRMYFLDKPIIWSPDGRRGMPEVIVPKGFVTDLASIPRIFWSLLPTDGAYTFPAIVHDYLYWTQDPAIPRETADLIFKYGMEDFKVGDATVFSIYTAVRAGGGGPWNKNAALRKAGERRLLVKFPEKPTTTWKEWQNEPGALG